MTNVECPDGAENAVRVQGADETNEFEIDPKTA
jgi:hypothetical protein